MPLITLSQGENTLGMTVTAEDMDKTNSTGADKSMWANTSSSSGGGSSSGGIWSAERQNVDIAKLSATNIDAGVTYTCNFTMTITVTADSEENNMYKALLNDNSDKHTGDLILHLGFAGETTGKFTNEETIVNDNDNGVKIDIANVPKEEADSPTTSGKTTVNGTINVSATSTSGSEAKITADLELVNKQSTPQNYLAGKDIKVTLITTASDCTASED